MVTEEEKLLKLMCSLQTHLVSPKEKKMHQEVIHLSGVQVLNGICDFKIIAVRKLRIGIFNEVVNILSNKQGQ